MRRFIADASHELRTPLTTIRGFAEYYRQRGGVRKDQNPLSRTDGGASAPVNGHSPDGLPREDLDRSCSGSNRGVPDGAACRGPAAARPA